MKSLPIYITVTFHVAIIIKPKYYCLIIIRLSSLISHYGLWKSMQTGKRFFHTYLSIFKNIYTELIQIQSKVVRSISLKIALISKIILTVLRYLKSC